MENAYWLWGAYRRAPELNHHPVEHNHELSPLRSGVLLALVLVGALGRGLRNKLMELTERLLALGGVAPDVYPVDRRLGVALDDLDDVLGGVHVGGTGRAIFGEIV